MSDAAPAGTVRELWRYPVKSMRGERLPRAAFDLRGLDGDRRFAVFDAAGKLGSGKDSRRFARIDGLRSLSARLGRDGPVVTGRDGAEVAPDALPDVLGQPVTVREADDGSHQDAAPVHLLSAASLAWIADRVGRPLDAFAFRPNIVFDTAAPWPAEGGWIGRVLRIGAVRLRVVRPTGRCVMVTVGEDGGRDDAVLRTLVRDNAACLGVYAEVIEAGTIAVDDRIETVPA